MATACTTNPTIGVIGGMGPEAGARFLELLIRELQIQIGFEKQEDYPRIMLDSLPVPDIIAGDRAGRSRAARARLKESLEHLARIGARLVAVPCNTVTVVLRSEFADLQATWPSIADATVAEIVAGGHRRVLLLGTVATLDSGHYQDALRSRSIEPITPSAKVAARLAEIIQAIVAGVARPSDGDWLSQQLTAGIRNHGADAAALVCTDLSVFPFEIPDQIAVVDSLRVYAQVIAQTYGAQHRSRSRSIRG